MRITPVILNTFYAGKDYKNNLTDYSPYRVPVRDIVTFSSQKSRIDTHEKFKRLMINFRVHCIYCKRPMSYDDNMINSWKQQGLFSAPITKFVEKIKPHKESLMPTEQTIFSIIEKISKKNPDARLSSVIKIMSVQANKKLLAIQEPILKEIVEISKSLSPQEQEKISKLLEKNRCRMLKIPYIDEFSPKEFAYKLKNILKSMPNDKNVFKLKRLYQLLVLPKLKHKDSEIDSKTIEKIEKFIGFNMENKDFRLGKNVKKSRKQLLNLIVYNIKQTALKTRNKDLIILCEENEKRLNGIPTITKFSNKALIYDLSEALEECTDKKIKSKILELACSLPNSSNSIHAFIAKHDQASDSAIAYNLLNPSSVSLEHMEPLSEGGPDSLKNWAGAHKRCNNIRQSKDMEEYFKIFDPENAQTYWDDIINLANAGYFSIKDLKGMFRIFKKESNIKVDSKNLRYRPDY